MERLAWRREEECLKRWKKQKSKRKEKVSLGKKTDKYLQERMKSLMARKIGVGVLWERKKGVLKRRRKEQCASRKEKKRLGKKSGGGV